jgi:hypothetical protein
VTPRILILRGVRPGHWANRWLVSSFAFLHALH